MKKLLILGMLLATPKIFACDQLVGTWECKDSDGSTYTHTYSKIPGGLKGVSSNEPEPFLIDGADHPVDVTGGRGSMNIVLNCNGNKISGKMVITATAGSEIPVKAIVELNGTVNGNDYSLSSKSATYVTVNGIERLMKQESDPISNCVRK